MFPFLPVWAIINDPWSENFSRFFFFLTFLLSLIHKGSAHSCLYKSWGRIKLSRSDVTAEFKSQIRPFILLCVQQKQLTKRLLKTSQERWKAYVKCSFACFDRGTLACFSLLSCLNNYHGYAYFLPSNLRSPHLSSGRGEAYQEQCSRATFFFSVGLIWQETWVFHTSELHEQAPPDIHLQRMKTPTPGKRCLQPKDNLRSASTPAFPSTPTRTRQ